MKTNFSHITRAMLVASSLATVAAVTSCDDFFETTSTHVIFDDQEHLSNATDTIYSLVGILNKLQAIGDRTVLLGEARGDLMDVNDYTASDLRDVALFNVSDDNQYNVPRDYYAIINNCNYYIAHADTAIKNNRNDYLFRNEFAAVKSIRAWVYLQLVTTYGRVPFVTEPILTKEQAEKDYPLYGINDVCNYFLTEDGLQALADVPYPSLGDIKGLESRLFYFPINIVLGDMNLWAGNYLQAARCYYDYISKRNGTNSTYPTSTSSVRWPSSEWIGYNDSWTISSFYSETRSELGELITLIPGDSIPSEGYYSSLRGIFNGNSDNDYHCSLVPSQGIIDLSESQYYCHFDRSGNYVIAPHNMENHKSGDLRLSRAWSLNNTVYKGERIELQTISKYNSRNIRAYRRTLVYLRMAEALNRAGYPRFAYQILSTGVNNKILTDSIISAYPADSALLAQFDFPSTRYVLYDPALQTTNQNTMGIHSRGCGYTPANARYAMPCDSTMTDSIAHLQWQIAQVEDMIMDEEALEFAFEGYRYYDLMRVALRRNDPAYLADRIYARRGPKNVAEMKSLITKDLYNPSNWFLNWNSQIGY